MRNPILAISAFALICGAAEAQTKIPVRPEPKAGQILHVTSAQEFSISVDSKAANASDAPPAAQIKTETVLGYTQKNGAFDDQGRMESQLTIERLDMNQLLNGAAKPSANTEKLMGRVLTAVFNRGGKLVDVKVPQDLQEASSVLKQLIAGAYGALNFLPSATMSVSDTATVPSTIPLQLPGSKSSVPYQTRTVLTLRAIEKSGENRIARFEQRIESAGESNPLNVNGKGTIDVNLDLGFVMASATEWDFAGAGAHGIMKVVMAAYE